MAKQPKTPISEEAKALTTRVGNRIIEAIKAIDEAFAVEGVHQRSVMKLENGNQVGYRTKPLLPGSEHFIDSFYLGAKGQLIFKAIPTETREYAWADVDEPAMDNVFPLVGSSLSEALGIDECEDFKEIASTVRARLIKEDEDAAVEALEEKKEADKAYENNPNYGRF
ncbi:hypothetical protein [Pararhizobium qamdonense]|uniref:hypothetical protein n=1 Tax=Pararhizobium qamdonense TaxID=3031126 RepID=UPI0023E1705F|nr:hypothetical protein [Pararhizobium qamdonense]